METKDSSKAVSAQSTVQELVQQAVQQNKRAKRLRGRARRSAYKSKGASLSLLLLLGYAEVDSVQFWGGSPVIGLTLPGFVRLHTLPTDLSPDACEIVFRQVTVAWQNSLPNVA